MSTDNLVSHTTETINGLLSSMTEQLTATMADLQRTTEGFRSSAVAITRTADELRAPPFTTSRTQRSRHRQPLKLWKQQLRPNRPLHLLFQQQPQHPSHLLPTPQSQQEHVCTQHMPRLWPGETHEPDKFWSTRHQVQIAAVLKNLPRRN